MNNLHFSRSNAAFLAIGILLGCLLLLGVQHGHGAKMKLKHLLATGIMALVLATQAKASGPYNGTVVGSPTYVTGKFGQALSVTTTTTAQGVALSEPGPADVVQGASWTIEGWFYLPATPANGEYLLKSNRGGGNNIYLQFNGNGVLYYGVGTAGGGGASGSFNGGNAQSLNTWHHVLLEYTGGKIYAGVDGAYVSSAGTTATIAASSSPTAYLGTDGTAANSLTGLIDEFSFSSTAQYPVGGTTYTAPGTAFANGRSGQISLYHFDGGLTDSNVNGIVNMALSATTVVPGQNITENVTGTGTSWTAGTTFSVATPGTITGAAISGISVNAAAQTATFTLTPGTLSNGTAQAQETISDSADSSTVGVNVQPFGIGSLLPTSVTPTSDAFSLGAVQSGVTPYGYLTYRSTAGAFTPSPGLLLPGESATPAASPLLADTGLTPGTTYYYKVVVSDSAGNTATTYEATVTTLLSAPFVVCVGDSITLGFLVTTWPQNSFPALLQTDLNNGSGRAWTVLNEGYTAAKTSDWTPTSTTNPTGSGQARGGGTNPGPVSTNIYNTMKAHIAATGLTPTLFIYRLGTNDEGNGSSCSPVSSVYANIGAWLTQAEADYPSAKFIIEAPIYTVPGSYNGNWAETGIANLSMLQSATTRFVDNVRVFPGTTKPWTYFMNAPSQYATSDGGGVHPNDTGQMALAQMEVGPVLSAINPPAIVLSGGQIKRGR